MTKTQYCFGVVADHDGPTMRREARLRRVAWDTGKNDSENDLERERSGAFRTINLGTQCGGYKR